MVSRKPIDNEKNEKRPLSANSPSPTSPRPKRQRKPPQRYVDEYMDDIQQVLNQEFPLGPDEEDLGDDRADIQDEMELYEEDALEKSIRAAMCKLHDETRCWDLDDASDLHEDSYDSSFINDESEDTPDSDTGSDEEYAESSEEVLFAEESNSPSLTSDSEDKLPTFEIHPHATEPEPFPAFDFDFSRMNHFELVLVDSEEPAPNSDFDSKEGGA